MDRYRIESPLGEGAMAQVFRAVDLSLNRPVALKILKAAEGVRPQMRQRFLREAKASARLSHPNVVQVYDAGETDGKLYLALELIAGRTLEQILEEDPPPVTTIARWMERIARGMHHAHLNGVIHRDLKPANIIISESGEPKIADFGLAHLVESETALTQSGTAVGTPLFMSPEQVSGHTRDISARSDIYALGAMLYQGLTGQTPHQAETIAELYGKILNETPREPRRLKPAIPADLETICLRALDKEPSRRYATAEAFADDLKRHLEGEPIKARPLSAWGRVARKARRNKALSAALAALLLVAVGMGGVLWVQRAKSDRRASALQRLSTLWATITERKRDLRQLKAPPDQARADLEKAVTEVDAHIRNWPDDPQGYYVRARGRLYLDDLEGAAQDLETALARRPDFRPGWSLLGMVKIEKYRALLWGDTHSFAERLEKNDPLLKSAVESFAKGWEAGREGEESQRWGLPWTREDQVQQRLARAMTVHYSERNREEAERILEAGTKEYRAEEYAQYLGLWSTGPAASLRWLNLAAEWAPGDVAVFMHRGFVKSLHGDFPGALADYDHVIELRKDFAKAYFNRGPVKQSLGDLPGALADLDRAIELKKDFPEAYSNRGVVKRAQGDLPGALADFDHAIELRKDFAGAYLNRGIAKEGLGNLPGAIADYDHAVELRKDFAEAYLARGLVKESQGDLPGAISDLDRAIDLKSDVALWFFHRGGMKQSQRDPSGALADYDRAIDLRTDFTEAYNNRGVTKKLQGDLRGALTDFDRTLELRKNFAEAYFNRGDTKRLLGDLTGALADLDRTLELRKDYADAYATRGSLKQSLGDLPGAIADVRKALEVAPPGWSMRNAAENWLRQNEAR